MINYLRVTVRFLDNRFHGLLDRGGPREWPPAPFRLFCAMVAGVARRCELDAEPGKALEWLQKLPAPIIIAPPGHSGQAFIRYVPNNDGDKKLDRQDRLAAKPTMPTVMRLGSDEPPSVHYLWQLEGQDVPHTGLRMAARSLTALGWGVDMAFADVAEPEQSTEEAVRLLPGERWYPKPGVKNGVGMLRVPVAHADLRECTLCDLRHCHETAMKRIEHGQPLHTVDKPRVFESVFYSSASRPQPRPFVTFRLRDENGETFRYSHAKLCHIAGMVRHLAINAEPPPGRDANWVSRVVRGMPDRNAADDHEQFAYLPLPSVGYVHVDGMIRNVMVVAPYGMDAELEHLAVRLSGEELRPESFDKSCEIDARHEFPSQVTLEQFTQPFISRCYLATAQVWHTVTPVILDGHHDGKANKMAKLIQTALRRAGVETPCEFTWQVQPFEKHGCGAFPYDRRRGGYHWPSLLRGRPAVHVRLKFAEPVSGPLSVGAGRYRGFGLFVKEE